MSSLLASTAGAFVAGNAGAAGAAAGTAGAASAEICRGRLEHHLGPPAVPLLGYLTAPTGGYPTRHSNPSLGSPLASAPHMSARKPLGLRTSSLWTKQHLGGALDMKVTVLSACGPIHHRCEAIGVAPLCYVGCVPTALQLHPYGCLISSLTRPRS